jgi:hypothetical protein
MAVAKNVQKATKSVKSATKKIAKKVDKAVVQPAAKMFESGGKSKKTSKAKPSRAKKAKK